MPAGRHGQLNMHYKKTLPRDHGEYFDKGIKKMITFRGKSHAKFRKHNRGH